MSCTRWKIELQSGGKVWGVVTADSLEEVVALRDRHVGFARQYARFFGQAMDDRYKDTSAPICDGCKPSATSGRWGTGQKFSGAASKQAASDAQTKIDALAVSLAEHMPNLTDAARLAQETKTARAAKRYAAHLKLAVAEVASAQLAADNAKVLHSAATAKKVSKSVDARAKALGTSLASLKAVVAKEVGRAHGGKYTEDNASGPLLKVEFKDAKVTATYVSGAASSTWFEGEVGLDGSVTGKSLVAPEKGTLRCKEHTVECGFVYVPSVLRFSEKPGAEGKKREAAELWFQQSQWVQAKPFSRGS